MAIRKKPLQGSCIAQYDDLAKDATTSKKQVNRAILYCENEFNCLFQDFTHSQVKQFLEQYYSYSSVIKDTKQGAYRSLLHSLNFMLEYLNWLASVEQISSEKFRRHPLQGIYWETKFLRDGQEAKNPSSGLKLTFQTDADYRRAMFMSEQEFKDFCFAVFPNDVYLHIEAALVLLWLGFSAKEIDDLKRNDFHDQTKDSTAYIQHGEHIAYISDPKFLQTIKLAINSDTYCGIYTSGSTGKQTIQVFKYRSDEKEYMLRRVERAHAKESTRADGKMASDSRLDYLRHFKRAIKPHQARLPENSPFRDKTIIPETVLLSGEFCRLKDENLPIQVAIAMADSYVSACNKRLSSIKYNNWYELSNQ